MIPSTLGNVESIMARANKSLSQKELWRAILKDAYEFFLPQKEVWDYYTPGYEKTDRIFDSTGQIAINEFANRMMSAITPQGTIWAQLEPGLNYPKEVREDAEILRQLQDINETLFSYINNSNFYTTMGEGYLDLAIGTAALTIEEGTVDNPLVYELINQAEVGYEAGPNGLIENIHRKRMVKGRNVERTYPGGNFSDELKNKTKNAPDEFVECIESMLFDPETGIYWIVVICEKEPIWTVNRGKASPWVAFRWAVTPGEVRGRGPALNALQDVKTLNKVEEFALQKCALELAGLWTGQDDGVLNPYSVTVQPGTIIPVSTNLSTNPTLARLDTGGPLQLTQFEIGRMQTSIRQHLYNNLRDTNAPVISATEAALNQRELASRIGSSFGRIQNEALVKILNASISVLQRLGIVPPIVIDGNDVAVKFTSPLSRAQDMMDLEHLQQAIGMTAQMAGPEAVAAGYKMEDIARYIGSKAGVDAHLIRSKEETEELMNQMAQQVEAQQGEANGEQVGV